jgi:hypothetical protein
MSNMERLNISNSALADAEYETAIVPDFTFTNRPSGGPYYKMEVPVGLDVGVEHEVYTFSRGQVPVSAGDSLECETISFIDWLTDRGARFPEQKGPSR